MSLAFMMRLPCALILAAGLVGNATAAPPRILFIGVDAVPYAVVAKLTDPALGDKALFKGMQRPAAVIESFPTDSHVAWSGLLAPFGIKKPLGYEGRYFDSGLRKVRGGLTLVDVPAPWERFFDWRLEGIVRGAIAYGWPKKYSIEELRQGLAAFLKSDKPFFTMYIVSTDGIGHIYGPDALTDFLREMDRELTALRQAHPEMPFNTVILSDHGMAGGKPLKNDWPQVEEAIEKAGLRVSERIEDASDAVFIPFGLLTSFEIYTWKGKEAQAASAVVSAPGVDFCVAPDEAGWKIFSARGNALIRRRPAEGGDLWSYRPLTGDPLGYEPVVAELRARARTTGESWFPDSWWFDATKAGFYPDALYRLARNFELVQNPASVACSVSPGYMFGALKTEYVAIPTVGRIKWTHGALHRDATLGVLMTDLPGWTLPEFVRFDRALVPLANRVKQNATLAGAVR